MLRERARLEWEQDTTEAIRNKVCFILSSLFCRIRYCSLHCSFSFSASSFFLCLILLYLNTNLRALTTNITTSQRRKRSGDKRHALARRSQNRQPTNATDSQQYVHSDNSNSARVWRQFARRKRLRRMRCVSVVCLCVCASCFDVLSICCTLNLCSSSLYHRQRCLTSIKNAKRSRSHSKRRRVLPLLLLQLSRRLSLVG